MLLICSDYYLQKIYIYKYENGFYKVAQPDVDLKKLHTYYKLWVLNAHHYSVFVSSCLVNKFAHTLIVFTNFFSEVLLLLLFEKKDLTIKNVFRNALTKKINDGLY